MTTPQPIVAAGLDAGSSWTRCVIAVLERRRPRIVGYGGVKSRGWVRGRIADQQAVSDCILAAVEEAEKMAETTIGTVVAGVGGVAVRGANARARMDLGRPRDIEQRDVNRIMERVMKVQLQEDRMILQVLPQDFAVDEQPGFHDPRGMTACVLEANAHLVTWSVQEHETLIGAINRAHLSVDETVHEAVAACYASVLPDDRKGGVALVDIGADSTEIVCYYGESAQLVSTLPVSGEHFSRDLAKVLCITPDAAATVKEEFGAALAAGIPDHSMVELPLPEASDRELREAPRRFVTEILEWRARELFALVSKELARAGMQSALANGLVIAGGGARLPRICDVAEDVLKCPVRLALTQGIVHWPDDINDPAWTTAAGLAMYAARLRTQVDLERQSAGVLGRILK
jgi:cell division protein FtsA